MTTRKAKEIKDIEEQVTKRLQANREFCGDLGKRLGISTELIGNAAYHTSITTDQSVLEILATVRTFHVWLEKVQEVRDELWQEETHDEEKDSE